MERIAIVSDIHANLPALRAFMNYIDTECKVSKVLNLGDFVQIGPNPTEVFDLVMNDSSFMNIMGNSEYMFFDEKTKKHYEMESEHQDWVLNQLGEERLKQLQELPLQRIVEIEEKKFFMIHARMNSVMDTPLLYDKKTFEEFIFDYNVDADYICFGHTHLPLYTVYWNNRPVINPGAIGVGKDGVIRFAIIEVNHGLVDFTFKQLRYDKEHVIRDYQEKCVPCRDDFIRKFY